jgi:hypothetical protein
MNLKLGEQNGNKRKVGKQKNRKERIQPRPNVFLSPNDLSMWKDHDAQEGGVELGFSKIPTKIKP